ncbi:MAG TPA: HAD-IC family P-type ATPase [Candidatus Limnocylindrales bacterium]|nr:HAD-IC family P-type ATPase [Candidatus Limnocylindrales bacterium]
MTDDVRDDPRLENLPPTPDEGLSDEEAQQRRAQGMGNDAAIRTGRTYVEILRDNALNPVNLLLVGISVVLAVLGLYGDAAVTVVLVVVNVVVGVYQEARAKQTLDRLSILTRPTATILRSGTERVTDQREAVLGDLMIVRLGDQLMLDGRVVGGAMEVDESLLTGEADRIPKHAGDEVLSGSVCVSGSATYRATRVGAESFANRLTSAARAFREDATPLQRDVSRVMRAMSILVAIAAVPVAIGIWMTFGGLDPVATARAAAVLIALVPQGLVVMITVTYALAIVRLAGGKALIQRSSAVESMSRVDVLCLDKTGTLTTPLIELVRVQTFADEAEVSSALGDFLASATLATRSADALRVAYKGTKQEIADEVTFSSELRWSGLRYASGASYILGAPEVVAPRAEGGQTGPVATEIGTVTSQWADEGLRVMLFARVPDSASLRDPGDAAVIPEGVAPLALFALREQLRPDARETLERLTAAGVRLKLISGDNPTTVAALTRQIGLVIEGPPMSGIDLIDMDDAGLADAVGKATIFGRVPPSLKARLVEALRSRGYWVAMVGDGVNDVMSLKQAHLGISMQSGSQATRAVADMVLLEDSFSALPAAVVEGQRIISGMQDSLHLFLTRAMYMALVIFGAALLGLAMPVSPRHNTVLALLTVGIPALFLALWARPARPGLDSLRRILRLVIPPALALAALGLPIYYYFFNSTDDLVYARTAFTTFAVFCGLGLLPLLEPPVGESMSGADADGADVRPTVLALALLALYGLFFVVPPVRDFFELTPLAWPDIALIAGAAVAWAVLVLLMWRARLVERVRAAFDRRQSATGA